MYIKFRSQNVYTFGVIWTYVLLLCIATCYFGCFWETTLFTIKKNLGSLPATSIYLHGKFKARWCYGFGSTALQ